MNISDKKVIVSLYLLGDDLDPAKISKELGVIPTEARRKGERRKSPTTGREYINKTGLWSFVIDRDHAEVAKVMNSLLIALEPYKKSIGTLSGIQDAYFDVFVAALADGDDKGSCEFSIESAQLAMLARFGVPIRFTVNVGHD